MLHHDSDGPSGEGPASAPPVLTALVMDDSSFLSSAVARDARRGMLTHGRLVKLVDLCAQLDRNGRALAGHATSR